MCDYQKFDTGSLLGAIPLDARSVENADINTELKIEHFYPQWGTLGDKFLRKQAHIYSPTLTPVTSGITESIQGLPVWRDDWRFEKQDKK